MQHDVQHSGRVACVCCNSGALNDGCGEVGFGGVMRLDVVVVGRVVSDWKSR